MKFTKKVLKNGLTILHEKRDVPVTTIMIGVKYGAKYENLKEKGIAHFIEHLCFKGTKTRTTEQISSQIEKIGGDLNAFTHEQITVYRAKIPSEHFNIAGEVIFDIFFNPTFPEKEVEKERQVICEELRMYKDHPRHFVIDKLKEALYEKPFGIGIGGTEETVRAIKREDILKKHSEVYSPENSVLCVVGNTDIDEVVKLAERFSVARKLDLKKNEPPKKIFGKKFEEKRKGIEQANIAIGIHFPNAISKERYAAELFNAILGEGMSSRLFREVREKRGLAYAVKTDADLGEDYGYYIIYIGTDKSKINEVIRVCIEEFKKMENVGEKEMEEAKEQLIGIKRLETEGSEETALNLILEESFKDAQNHYKYEENIKKVKLENVRDLAKAKNFSVVVLSP